MKTRPDLELSLLTSDGRRPRDVLLRAFPVHRRRSAAGRGMIHRYSEEGRGTTYKVYLLEVVGSAAERRSETRPDSIGETEAVLIVEDDNLVRAVGLRVLETAGYRVVAASSMAAARAAAE